VVALRRKVTAIASQEVAIDQAVLEAALKTGGHSHRGGQGDREPGESPHGEGAGGKVPGYDSALSHAGTPGQDRGLRLAP